ncbi:hypothetical protein ZWY2020_033351 [Hordeum vulgare]|nr:hypothetical protein ZWY2020_033351 [Hordeum vulgare]
MRVREIKGKTRQGGGGATSGSVGAAGSSHGASKRRAAKREAAAGPSKATQPRDDVAEKNFFLADVDRRGRRRVDVFSLAFHVGQLAQPDLKRRLDYAAACSVEDLQLRLDGAVGRRDAAKARCGPLHFPSSPLLARLSVRGLHLTIVGAANLRSLIVVDSSRTIELRKKISSSRTSTGAGRWSTLFAAFHVSRREPISSADYRYRSCVEDLQLRLDGAVCRRDARGGQRRVRGLAVHFPVGSPLLARLSVRGLHLTIVGAANLRSLIVVDSSRTIEKIFLEAADHAAGVVDALRFPRIARSPISSIADHAAAAASRTAAPTALSADATLGLASAGSPCTSRSPLGATLGAPHHCRAANLEPHRWIATHHELRVPANAASALPMAKKVIPVVLAFHVGQLAQPDLKRCLDYAAAWPRTRLR